MFAVNATVVENEMMFKNTETSISRPVRFCLFLILVIPSIYCSLVLLFHLLVNRNLRTQVSNHIVITLLIVGLLIELISIPLHLHFLRMGFVQPATPILCLVWFFLDIGLYNGCTIIMAWGSIQRYLLIFHDRLFPNTNKRFLLHYLPLIILTLYIFIFYFIVIVFPPCVNTFDYTLPVCNDFPCYLDDPFLGIWDSVMNSIVPTIIISVFSILLLIRVYVQKRRVRQPIRWRKQRKMTIVLLFICILYLCPSLPLNILIFAHLCGLPDNQAVELQLFFDLLCYCVTLLFPFICLSILSELRKKIQWKGLLLFRTASQIASVSPK